MLPVNAEPPKKLVTLQSSPRGAAGGLRGGPGPVCPFSQVLSGSESAAAGRCGVEVAESLLGSLPRGRGRGSGSLSDR